MSELETYKDLCTKIYDLSKPNPPSKAYEFYLAHCRSAQGPVLEPFCGSGRFLLPLMEEGINIEGFDASPSMLAALHEKAQRRSLKPKVWQGFANELNKQNYYRLAFIPSGSFGLILDDDEVLDSLERLYTCLVPGGKLVFELETLEALPENFGKRPSDQYILDARSVIKATYTDKPPVKNIISTECCYELFKDSQLVATEIENFKVRCWEPNEFVKIVDKIGFKDVVTHKAFLVNENIEPTDDCFIVLCTK